VPEAIKILVLCGSLRKASVTHRALEAAVRGITGAGGEAVWADEWINRLPYCSEESAGDPVVRAFKAEAAEADGFLLGSPEYHGSLSGLLKNALDFLYLDQTEDKWAALVGTAGGRQGASATLNAMRIIARALRLWVIHDQVSIASAHKVLNGSGAFTDEEIENRLQGLGAKLVEAARAARRDSGAPSI